MVCTTSPGTRPCNGRVTATDDAVAFGERLQHTSGLTSGIRAQQMRTKSREAQPLQGHQTV